jgi:hypothetical protein
MSGKMKRPRKYGPGEPIRSLHDLDCLFGSSTNDAPVFIWVAYSLDDGRVEHIGYTVNRSYLWIRGAVLRGNLRRAVVTDEYRDWLRAELGEAGPDMAPSQTDPAP